MPFQFEDCEISGVQLIRPEVFGDNRGRFWECYKRSAFRKAGIEATFVQDSHSVSERGVLRGLHFQRPPAAQAKLVRVTGGTIFDVAVDLRAGSEDYGSWMARTLTADGGEMLFVPKGFAHGFCVVSERAAVHYKVSAEYAPEQEGGVRWDDPDLGIDWPIEDPVLSQRDRELPVLRQHRPEFKRP